MSDISRQTFNPRKHYIDVVMQQGRVQLDADWNEQQAIYQHRIETEARDVIGQNGVPQAGGGFRIGFTPDHSDLTISAGRIYVDGLLCELEEATPVPVSFLDANRVQVKNWLVDGQAFERGQWVEFLDENMQFKKLIRILNADVDKQILTLYTDKANYDTEDLRKLTNLSLRRRVTYTTQPYCPTTIGERAHPAFANYPSDTNLPTLSLHDSYFLLIVYLDVWKRHVTWLDDPHIREVALGGPDTTTRVQTVWQVKILPIELHEQFTKTLDLHRELEQQLLDIQEEERRSDPDKVQALEDGRAIYEQEIATFSSTLTGNSAFSEWDALIAPTRGKLSARTRPPDTPGNPGYQRLENQLYRVEVDNESGEPNGPSFKWARDNGSVVARIESISDDKVVVQGIGLNDNRSFDKGQWVELFNDEIELNALQGHFVQIKDVDSITGALTMTAVLPKLNGMQYTKIRRWNGSGTIATDGIWADLESGVQVQFSPGVYKRGDYWQIPARTATGDVEWPQEVPNRNPIPQGRVGIQHHYARLARVLLFRGVSAQDCRRQFPPLAAQAMHILAVNWRNDGEYSREKLKDGLHITLDAVPDPLSINPSTMIVTVEPALPGHGGAPFIMSGHIEVEANNVYWRWGHDEEGAIPEFLDKLGILFHGPKHSPRVRVVLKGHYIWSRQGGQMLYLDGQTFGRPGVQDDGQTPCLALRFPSGKGARASDFESWFTLTGLS